MSEPERWLKQGGGLTAIERKLLESAERIAPPAGSKQQVWSALAASLPAAPFHSAGDPGSGVRLTPRAGAGQGAGASSALGAGAVKTQSLIAGSVLKALAVGFALGAASMGTVTWLAPSETRTLPASSPAPPTASERAPLRVPALAKSAPTAELALPSPPLGAARARPALRVETSAAAEAQTAPTPVPVEPGAARAAFPDVSPTPPPVPAEVTSAGPNLLDRARLESRRVAEARSRLRGGDARGALGLLAAIASEFPNGVLVQEREALTIEALLACGERQAASERALDFVKRYPGSPHTSLVQRALQ